MAGEEREGSKGPMQIEEPGFLVMADLEKAASQHVPRFPSMLKSERVRCVPGRSHRLPGIDFRREVPALSPLG